MKALMGERNDAIDSPKAADDDGDGPKNGSSNESLGEVSNFKKPFTFIRETFYSSWLTKNSLIMKLNWKLLSLEKILMMLLKLLKLLKQSWTQD